jgi:hypothetical protein
VNAQDTRHWDTENPHAVNEVPLHDQRWVCGMRLVVGE